MAATIADILGYKGTDVIRVGASAPAREVVALLARHGIGAVVVVDDADVPRGVAAERDLIHALAREGTGVLGTPISRIMSTEIPTCRPEAKVDDVAALMTQGRHRHVPVVVDGSLAGIVSVGDVVRSRLENLSDTAEQLQAYVAGTY
ncbi:MAG: CBS domain-containing protein [Nitriliruptoraceae bacterium]